MDTFNNISWLASYPKSGSTWVRMFINAFMTKMPLNINSAYQMSRRDIDPGVLQLICPTSILSLTAAEQFIYRPAMLMNMLKLSPGRLVLKTHSAKINLEGIPAHPIPISDCALYILRDPRDVVISLADHLGCTVDATIEFMNNISQGIEDATTNCVDLLLTWSEHVASWTVKNSNIKTCIVRYEDMLIDPVKMFTQILDFLQLTNVKDYERRFEFALVESSFSSLKNYERDKGFIEKGEGKEFFRVGKSGQWKDFLTTDQIEKIENDHYEIMEEFGYEKNLA